MIKKLIGIVAALAVIAVIVLTVLHRDRYRSMVFGSERSEAPARASAPTGPADASDAAGTAVSGDAPLSAEYPGSGDSRPADARSAGDAASPDLSSEVPLADSLSSANVGAEAAPAAAD